METSFFKLISDLKIDMGESTLDTNSAERALTRAIIIVNQDLEADYQFIDIGNNKQIQPEPAAIHKELILLQAQIHLFKINMNQKTESISFKSGNKQVKKTSAKQQDILKSLQDEYENLLGREKPASDNRSDVLTPNIGTAVYKRGRNNE